MRVNFQPFGDFGWIGHALGRKNDKEAVTVGIVEGNFGGAGVALGVGVAEDVDRIGVAPVRRKKSVESLRRRIRKAERDRHRCAIKRIGGENAGTASVSEDGEMGAARARLFAKDIGHVEELGDAVNTKDAAAAEGGVVDFVAAGHGAGVRSGGFGGSFGAASFNDDDRFVE